MLSSQFRGKHVSSISKINLNNNLIIYVPIYFIKWYSLSIETTMDGALKEQIAKGTTLKPTETKDKSAPYIVKDDEEKEKKWVEKQSKNEFLF